MIDLAKRLVYLRESKDLSQVAVARMLNMSQTGYFSYESGRSAPPVETLVKLADFYNVSVDFLLGHNRESIELHKLNQDIMKLPPDHQQRAIDYVKLLKLDAAYQVQQNKKAKKRAQPQGIKQRHLHSPSPQPSDARGLAAQAGGVKEIDEEIEEDLQNLDSMIRNDKKESPV